jgi:hypothetical protein
MKKRLVAHLDVLDWGGAFNGEHFQGWVRWTAKDTIQEAKLTNALSVAEAKLLNKKDNDARYAGSFLWKPGDKSERFFSLRDIENAAVSFCRKHEEIGLLVNASYATAQPAPILYCVNSRVGRKLGRIGNRVAQLYDDVGDPWSSRSDEMSLLDSEWYSILRSEGFTDE